MPRTNDDPAFVARLRKIKASLEHARRFGFDTVGNYRSAAVQAEGDIEELLIDYGLQRSNEREPDPRVKVSFGTHESVTSMLVQEFL